MGYSDQKLNDIYDRTDGCCHICGRKLAFRNYGTHGARGAWHVEHSRARANGGTNHANNLYAACIPCNLEKSCGSTRSARAKHGRTSAPLSMAKKAERRTTNAAKGAALGAIGAIVLGASGPAVWLAIGMGAFIGHDLEPDPQKGMRSY